MYHSSGKLNTGFVGANMLRVEKRDKLGWLGRQAVSGAAAGARRAEGIRRAVRKASAAPCGPTRPGKACCTSGSTFTAN